MKIGQLIISFMVFSFAMGGFSYFINGFTTEYNASTSVDYSDYDFTTTAAGYTDSFSNESSGDLTTGGETAWSGDLLNTVLGFINIPNLMSEMLGEVGDDVGVPLFASNAIMGVGTVLAVLGVMGILWRFSMQ